jgi:hypothetical protein
MINKFKVASFAAVLAFSAGSALALDLGITTDMQDFITAIDPAEVGFTTGASSSTLNVGLISQTGDGNIAYINQSGGTGNFAAIIQDTSAGSTGVGYIMQSGASNRAVINQK